jgi:hypothetical protein
MTTYEEAVDQIFGIFKTAWDAGASAIVGYTPEVLYPGVEEPKTMPKDKYWSRISQQTADEPQTGMRNGENGQRYTTSGLVFVQIFCPKSESLGLTNGRLLANLARNSYRGNATDCKVWFRNARIVELDPEENWYRLNVVAEYEYDEIA